MRTYSTLALLVLGLVLAPLVSPRPAVAASATVTYAFTGGLYADQFTGGAPVPVISGSVTVNLFGPTVVPGVSASWTGAAITGLTWLTPGRPAAIGLINIAPTPAAGTGTVGGSGNLNLAWPVGPATLVDPVPVGTRSIIVSFGSANGFFTGGGAGFGSLVALGLDLGPWSLIAPASLVEVSSSVSIAPIPEPGSASLLGLGLLAGGVAARLRARRGSRRR